MHASGGEVERRSAGPTAEVIARRAAVLFAERGYDATPVRAIADAAGVTCPTLYYHFGSKEGIAQALLLRPLERLRLAIREVVAMRLEPVERLTRVVEAHLAFIREDPDRGRLLLAVMFGPLGSEVASEVKAAIDRILAADREALEALAAAGMVRPEHLDDLLLCLRGQYIIRSADFLHRGRPLDAGLASRFVEQTLYGFAAARGRGPAETP